MENLPLNYSRIFQFQSFERTRHRILAEAAAEEEGAMVKRTRVPVFFCKCTCVGFVASLTLRTLLLQVGWYVTLHIVDVPSSVMESVQSGRPLMLVSLLPHEQKVCHLKEVYNCPFETKSHWQYSFIVNEFSGLIIFPLCAQMSVMHLLVRRHPSNTEPIKSKEELVFHCGFRRFRASPIFSQHTSGS